MAIENVTAVAPAFQPVIDTLQPLIVKFSVVVGGLFGLYVLLLIIRVYYERRKVKYLQAILYDLDHLNRHNNVPYSKMRKSLLTKVFDFFRYPGKR